MIFKHLRWLFFSAGTNQGQELSRHLGELGLDLLRGEGTSWPLQQADVVEEQTYQCHPQLSHPNTSIEPWESCQFEGGISATMLVKIRMMQCCGFGFGFVFCF